MNFNRVMFKKICLFVCVVCSFCLRAATKTCIDFTEGGVVPLIIILEKEIQETLASITVTVNIQNESIVDTLTDVIWKSTVSIIDALDEDADFIQGKVRESTLSIVDKIEDLSDIEQLIKDRNVSKSGNIVRCSPGIAFEITEPGYYALEDNTNCCIYIRSSDVTVDLNDFTLFCTDDDVIKTDSSLKNIEIKNGKIKSDGNHNGILINNSCELISIDRVSVFDCDCGITGSALKDLVVQECVMTDCLCGAQAEFSEKCVYKNSSTFSCANFGFKLNSCKHCAYDNCRAIATSNFDELSASGFYSDKGSKNLFLNCKVVGTTGNGSLADTNTITTGIFLKNETGSKVFNCLVNRTVNIRNDATSISVGILLLNQVSNCVIESNEVLNAEGGFGVGNATGAGILVLPSTSAASENNLFIKNITYNNSTINIGPTSANIPDPYIRNIYVYDHDGSSTGDISPKLLDNLDIVEP